MLMGLALLCALAGEPSTPAEAPAPARYGDRGTSHFGLGLGLGLGSGKFQAAGGFDYGYFVLDGVAPGIEAQVSGGTGLLTTGLLLGNLRLVPLRTSALSAFIIGRGGRVLIAHHQDGWGVGGGAGVIFFTGGRVGIQITYDVLRLLPAGVCADLSGGCTMQGLSLGLVMGF